MNPQCGHRADIKQKALPIYLFQRIYIIQYPFKSYLYKSIYIRFSFYIKYFPKSVVSIYRTISYLYKPTYIRFHFSNRVSFISIVRINSIFIQIEFYINSKLPNQVFIESKVPKVIQFRYYFNFKIIYDFNNFSSNQISLVSKFPKLKFQIIPGSYFKSYIQIKSNFFPK